MITRRIALSIVFAGVVASATLVSLVRAQQTPPTQQTTPAQQTPPTQQTGPAQQIAPSGTRNPPITDQPIRTPPATPTSSELENLLLLLDCHNPQRRSVLEPHCDATETLIKFIDRLASPSGPIGSPIVSPSGTVYPFPRCELDMVGAINDISLKVNTAIEFHKYSDKIFDDPLTEQRKILPRDKSKLTTDNDIKIKLITEILSPYVVRHDLLRSESAPLIYHRDIVRYATEVLAYNNRLSQWGVDAGFLTAARGYAIYQFVFNCVRTHDIRLWSALATARAFAVRSAAESESWILRRIETLQLAREERPMYWRWRVELDLIEGGRGKGGGFPTQIYLGSSHSYNRWLSPAPTAEQCDPGLVHNFYGLLRKVQKDGVTNNFEFVRVVDQCENEINQNGWPAMNALLTNATRAYVPKGGGLKDDYERQLRDIARVISNHIQNIIDDKNFEACLLSDPNYPPDAGVNCEALAKRLGEQREEAMSQAIAREKDRIGEELKALHRMAFAIRNILAPRTIYEERRGQR